MVRFVATLRWFGIGTCSAFISFVSLICDGSTVWASCSGMPANELAKCKSSEQSMIQTYLDRMAASKKEKIFIESNGETIEVPESTLLGDVESVCEVIKKVGLVRTYWIKKKLRSEDYCIRVTKMQNRGKTKVGDAYVQHGDSFAWYPDGRKKFQSKFWCGFTKNAG